jgi:hypothetical protein
VSAGAAPLEPAAGPSQPVPAAEPVRPGPGANVRRTVTVIVTRTPRAAAAARAGARTGRVRQAGLRAGAGPGDPVAGTPSHWQAPPGRAGRGQAAVPRRTIGLDVAACQTDHSDS